MFDGILNKYVIHNYSQKGDVLYVEYFSANVIQYCIHFFTQCIFALGNKVTLTFSTKQ